MPTIHGGSQNMTDTQASSYGEKQRGDLQAKMTMIVSDTDKCTCRRRKVQTLEHMHQECPTFTYLHN